MQEDGSASSSDSSSDSDSDSKKKKKKKKKKKGKKKKKKKAASSSVFFTPITGNNNRIKCTAFFNHLLFIIVGVGFRSRSRSGVSAGRS